MSLDQLAFIHRAQFSFFDNKLAANDRVIRIDRLPEDNRSDGIVHAGKADAIEIDGEEVGTLSTFQASNISSTNNRRAPTRAEI